MNDKRIRACLDCSELAYMSDPTNALRNIGLTLLNKYDRDDTQAFLAIDANAETLYLAFRGTESFSDWMTDLNYVKTDLSLSGRVHKGFLSAFNAVRDDIYSDLTDFRLTGVDLVVTGHSLGAALAQIAGVVFVAQEGYVFGSPRVGNTDFAKAVKYSLTRFEHQTDPVTYLPPRTSFRQALYALLHGRLPTLYDRAGHVIFLDGKFHRMHHYRPSTLAYIARRKQLTNHGIFQEDGQYE